MPRGNGTGPMGFGPGTGRAAGYCAGYGMPGFINPVSGFGAGARFGRGHGGGRGWRNMFHATGLAGWQRSAMGWPAYGGVAYGAPVTPAMSREQEVDALKEQAEILGEQLGAIKKRMEDLSATDRAGEGK